MSKLNKKGTFVTNVSEDKGFMDELLDLEDEKKKWRQFRRNFVPATKKILTTVADFVGDWAFYILTKNGDAKLDEYETPLLVFCIISAVMTTLTVISVLANSFPSCAKNPSKAKKFLMDRINFFLGLEMFLENIPQLVLTTMVALDKRNGEWTPVAVFNLTTSVYNFTFNTLDLLLPLPEEKIEAMKAEEEAMKAEKAMKEEGVTEGADVPQLY